MEYKIYKFRQITEYGYVNAQLLDFEVEKIIMCNRFL